MNVIFVHHVLRSLIFHHFILPIFLWNSCLDGTEFCEFLLHTIRLCTSDIHLFMVPFGRAGTEFVTGLTYLFNCYGNASALECNSMKAALVMPALLLQCPHCHSKSRDHLAYLERRLPLWSDGNILPLLEEGDIIQ